MSVTKVTDLHESAAALDMIGDSTKKVLRKKNCACSQIAASDGRQRDLQVRNTVGYLFSGNKDSQCAVKISAHYIHTIFIRYLGRALVPQLLVIWSTQSFVTVS